MKYWKGVIKTKYKTKYLEIMVNGDRLRTALYRIGDTLERYLKQKAWNILIGDKLIIELQRISKNTYEKGFDKE